MRPNTRSATAFLGVTLLLPVWTMAQQASTPSTGAATSAREADVKRADIRKLIEITGTRRAVAQMLPQILAPMKSSFPQVPDRFWQETVEEFKMDELVDRLVPVYEKYYTRDDILGIIAFYQSPLGQKLISTQPQVMQESLAVGQEFGQEVAARVEARLKKEGYLKESDTRGGSEPALRKN